MKIEVMTFFFQNEIGFQKLKVTVNCDVQDLFSPIYNENRRAFQYWEIC